MTKQKNKTVRSLSEWDMYKEQEYERLRKMNLRCPCGESADALHFLDKGLSGHYPRLAEDVEIVYSCKSHDWAGYMIMFDDLFTSNWDHHLGPKLWFPTTPRVLDQWNQIPHHYGINLPGAPKW